MTSSIANINGTNVTRLAVEQFGSNESSVVLQNPLLSDSVKYDVTIERFNMSSDIPIFKANTPVFDVVNTAGKIAGDPLIDAGDANILATCTVGPTYNWLDFAYQIQEFLVSIRHAAVLVTGTLDLAGSTLPQKNLCFDGTPAFWRDKVLVFTAEFAKILELGDTPVMWTRYAGGQHFTYNKPMAVLLGNVPQMVTRLGDGWIFTAFVSQGFADGIYDSIGLQTDSKMDTFENRHKIRIDSVLPLPHEVFGSGAAGSYSAQMSNRYTFLEFDFPKETMFSKMRMIDQRMSDNVDLSQILHTGVFQLVKPAPHSGLKKMLAGQTQDHRYEIFLIRKRVAADGSMLLEEEPWPMGDGDYFRMVLLFTQEV